MKSILIIAGSDTFGGAGIQADIKTAYKLGYHPFTIISALTAQNSVSIKEIMPVTKDFISKQLDTVLEDVRPDSVKIGMLFSSDIINIIADKLLYYNLSPIVLDPLVRASVGKKLLSNDGVDILKNRLFPLADVITPNKYEAEFFLDLKINTLKDMEEAAKRLFDLGPNVVITGYITNDAIIDVVYNGKKFFYVKDKKINATNSHGSGCVFSTSLSIFLSEKTPLFQAVYFAHNFTKKAIQQGYPLGKGSGAVLP